MKPFDEKSREMDREIRGLWILLLAGFILYSLPWALYSDGIIDKFATMCVSNGRIGVGMHADCIASAGAIAAFVALQAVIIVLLVKIGRHARKFMEHYNKAAAQKPAAKGKTNGGRRK
jgi:hypothetical protein